jgi:hypothetical protein
VISTRRSSPCSLPPGFLLQSRILLSFHLRPRPFSDWHRQRYRGASISLPASRWIRGISHHPERRWP